MPHLLSAGRVQHAFLDKDRDHIIHNFIPMSAMQMAQGERPPRRSPCIIICLFQHALRHEHGFLPRRQQFLQLTLGLRQLFASFRPGIAQGLQLRLDLIRRGILVVQGRPQSRDAWATGLEAISPPGPPNPPPPPPGPPPCPRRPPPKPPMRPAIGLELQLPHLVDLGLQRLPLLIIDPQ